MARARILERDRGGWSAFSRFPCTYSDLFDSDLITSGAECIYPGTEQLRLGSQLERTYVTAPLPVALTAS
jgi:hypothetical protein